MYRYSMTQWIAGDEDIEVSFKRLKKLGYDGIEYAGEPYSLDIPRLKELMKTYQLDCTSICGIFKMERDLSSDDQNTVTNAIQYLKDCVDMAVEVGAPYIIVVPSPVGKTTPDSTYDAAWNNSVKNIRLAADYAESKGIQFAIEALNRFETYMVNNLTKALEFVGEVNHPAVKLMADLFHMNIEENNFEQILRDIAPYLIHVHIADNTREAAGFGRTDFKNLIYTLKDIGYTGPLTMEFLPRVANPYEASGMESREQLMDSYAKQSIEHMKQMEASCLRA
jgi:D-psicose/D-tagatose/L-ribulose 3-epimerase